MAARTAPFSGGTLLVHARLDPGEATIPIPDLEVLPAVDDVSPADAERGAEQLHADIKAGEYPKDARVSVMSDWSSSF